MPIADIKIGDRIRQDYGNLEHFARRIDDLGFLICPIAVTSDYKLLDGARRLEATKLLGWKELPVVIIHLENDGTLDGR